MERFNFKKLNDMEIKEQYQVKISNRFAALENFTTTTTTVVVVVDDDDDDDGDEVNISRAWESIIRVNMKASATEDLGFYELKQHKLWFDEECSKSLDQREQAELQWLQNLS